MPSISLIAELIQGTHFAGSILALLFGMGLAAVMILSRQHG